MAATSPTSASGTARRAGRSYQLSPAAGTPRPRHGCHVADEQRATQRQDQVRDEIFAKKHGVQFSWAMSAKSVYCGMNAKRAVPVGPLRCFATMISAMPRSAVSSL